MIEVISFKPQWCKWSARVHRIGG